MNYCKEPLDGTLLRQDWLDTPTKAGSHEPDEANVFHALHPYSADIRIEDGRVAFVQKREDLCIASGTNHDIWLAHDVLYVLVFGTVIVFKVGDTICTDKGRERSQIYVAAFEVSWWYVDHRNP